MERGAFVIGFQSKPEVSPSCGANRIHSQILCSIRFQHIARRAGYCRIGCVSARANAQFMLAGATSAAGKAIPLPEPSGSHLQTACPTVLVAAKLMARSGNSNRTRAFQDAETPGHDVFRMTIEGNDEFAEMILAGSNTPLPFKALPGGLSGRLGWTLPRLSNSGRCFRLAHFGVITCVAWSMVLVATLETTAHF